MSTFVLLPHAAFGGGEKKLRWIHQRQSWGVDLNEIGMEDSPEDVVVSRSRTMLQSY